ncbi:MAG: hypothetical protein ACHQDY_07900, partial [Solirubrobacterales bacterium]
MRAAWWRAAEPAEYGGAAGPARALVRRLLVRLVLVASIAPVILLGPTLARAPAKLLHELALRQAVACTAGAPHASAVAVACAARHTHRSSRSHGHLPGRVRGLRVLHSTPAAVRIVWRRARGGRFPIEGYRVWRDGTVVGQTPGRSYALRLGAARVHVVAVAAVDARGHLGPRSSLAIGVHLPAGEAGGGSGTHGSSSHPSRSAAHGAAPTAPR